MFEVPKLEVKQNLNCDKQDETDLHNQIVLLLKVEYINFFTAQQVHVLVHLSFYSRFAAPERLHFMSNRFYLIKKTYWSFISHHLTHPLVDTNTQLIERP